MYDLKKYSSTDIARYLASEMSNQEMHAFEKAMMADPFLADALEGYRSVQLETAVHHTKQIAETITQQNTEAPVVPVYNTNFKWWRIAAIFVLVMGGTGTYYLMNRGEKSPGDITSLNKSLPEADSIKPAKKPIANTDLLAAKKNAKQLPNTGSPVLVISPDNEIAMAATTPADTINKGIALQGLSTNPPELSASTLSRRSESKPAGALLNEFKGRVVDQEGEPIAFATITATDNSSAITDSKGNFLIKAPDTLIILTISSMGYEPFTARASSSKSQQFNLTETAKDLSDVVINAMGRKKQFNALIDKNEYLNKQTGSRPARGWQYFNTYFLKNIQAYRDTANEYTSGEIELEFDIDSKGRPQNIFAVEANDNQNKNKAIELLLKGPLWVKGKTPGKARVILSL